MNYLRLRWIGWLLLLGIVQVSAQPETPLPRFEQIPAERSGITCVNRLPEGRYRNIIVYQYYYNGGGVGIGDLNGDGLPEVVLTQNIEPNKLYLNRGNFRFDDVSETAGIRAVGAASWSTGVALADVNQDGRLDIYISRSGNLQPENRKNLLYLNQGNDAEGVPHFKEEAAKWGLDEAGYSIQTVFLDYDRDGDLDAFVMNHGMGFFNEDPQVTLTARDPYSGDKLLQNQNGSFVDVTESAGINSTAIGYGLGVAVEDFNRDGWPDLYVSNDFLEHDYLYLNQQDGTFRESIHTATRHISNYSMGNDAADINNDGWPDVMVVDMVAEDNRRLKANMSGMNPDDFQLLLDNGFHHQYMFNTLHLNQGNDLFSDVAQLAGVSNTDWSWAPLLADFDNDGWKDLFVSNGLRKDVRNTDFRNAFGDLLEKVAADPNRTDLSVAEWQAALATMPSERVPNYAFRNRGDLSFEKVSAEWGLDTPGFSNGAAYGDLDGDGDLDVVVSNIDEAPFVYRNQTVERKEGHFLRIQLEGPPTNRQGLGVQVRVRIGQDWQYHRAYAIRGYQSSVEPVVHIGLGRAATVDELVAVWPDGRQNRLTDVEANQVLTLRYVAAQSESASVQTVQKGPFEAVAAAAVGLDFRHRENDFDDFEQEVLLPHKMSRFGPALATADVNGDGREDVFVGGAIGQSGQLFLQQADGTFAAQETLFDPQCEDLDAAFFDLDGDGDADLYVVSGGNEYAEGDVRLADRLYLNDGTGYFSRFQGLMPELTVSGACVRPFDFDGDGDMDLFIGGRQKPGAYPLPGSSYLLENDEGFLLDVTAERAPELASIGRVTDAVWTDYDSDGDADLLVVGEWMPLVLLENTNGSFARKAMPIHCEGQDALTQLSQTTGWWSSLIAADLDGDGDDDYVAGNLGLNYKYKASPEAPFEVYSDDFDGNGERDIVLSYYQNGESFPLRGRSCSSQQIPLLKQKFPSYNEFASATLTDVYGDLGLMQALHYEAHTFASYYIENRGTEWLFRPLPNEAQLSSLNAIIPHDFTGDGQPDLLLAGNLYASEVETPRNDASVGLLLCGDGKGTWQSIPAWESDFYAPGDVKKTAMIPWRDAWLVLVANNDGQLQAFRWQAKK